MESDSTNTIYTQTKVATFISYVKVIKVIIQSRFLVMFIEIYNTATIDDL